MQILIDFIDEFWTLFLEMSPYLLLGFLFAGILSVYVSADKLKKYLGKNNLKSIVNASLVGVPLPLCSCGVIPTGVSFYKNGASKSATTSFLISTPQTGLDSIMITYSLLGLPFALIRPIIALFTGVFGGLVNKYFIKNEPKQIVVEEYVEQRKSNVPKWKQMLRYAFVDFLDDISKWLIIGLLLAAIIGLVVPPDFFETYIGNPYLEMLLVMLAAIPLYICATGSVPIAAVLLLKGLSPGAALVFLMAGPATNAATITVIGNSLGKKTLFAYLSSIIVSAFLFGSLINEFLPVEWFQITDSQLVMHAHGVAHTFYVICAIILAVLLLASIYRKYFARYFIEKFIKTNDMEHIIQVSGMDCNHCKANIEKNIMALAGMDRVEANLQTGQVLVVAENPDIELIERLIIKLGYQVVK